MLIKGSRRYNLRHNTERTASPEVGRMINGQALGAVSKLRYGICRMSFNGCEVIAVHNALVYLGIPKPLTDIAFYMERFRVLMGFFGCNAYKLGKALKHFGAECSRVKTPDDSKAFIITFWTGRRLLSSVHTVFCIRKETELRFITGITAVTAPKCAEVWTRSPQRKRRLPYTV